MDLIILALEAIAFLLIAILLLWSTKSLFLIYEKWIDQEDEFSTVLNISEAIRRAGLFLGSAIALSAPLIYSSHETFRDDIYIILIDAVAIVIKNCLQTKQNKCHILNGFVQAHILECTIAILLFLNLRTKIYALLFLLDFLSSYPSCKTLL